MLPKEQRLDTQGVALVFGVKRKTRVTKYFKVVTALIQGITHKKYAVVVSKKITHSAVERNKLRRRVYQGIKKMNISPTPPKAVLVQCTKESLQLSATDFFHELEKVLKTALV